MSEDRHGSARAVRCTVVTVSRSRTLETDDGGREMARLLERDGHEVVERTVVPTEPSKIALVVRHWLGAEELDAVFLNGGTGFLAGAPGSGSEGAPSRLGGTTVEVVRQFLEREIPGFGELFRYLSFQEVGAPAMLSSALAGIAQEKAVFCLPGSVKAIRLGLERLVLPEVRHLVGELRKH